MWGSRSEVPNAVCRISNGTNATYVIPSENTSGRVPRGNRCATRSGGTGQCTKVRSAQNWSKNTGRGIGGAVSGMLTTSSWHDVGSVLEVLNGRDFDLEGGPSGEKTSR